MKIFDFLKKECSFTENFEMPTALMKRLLNDPYELFDSYTNEFQDLSFDNFTTYFQDNHSDRNNFMQDFTPPELCKLVANLSSDCCTCLDMCAGTGGLSIAMWNHNKNINLVCEEISKNALPVLIFNLAVRNIEATVRQKNILTNEVLSQYILKKGGRFASIEKVAVDLPIYEDFDMIVSNPPYSQKWDHDIKSVDDPRFMFFGYPPKQYSDYAFVIDAFHRLKKGGEMFFILPHGVLFRGSNEKAIRKKIVQKDLLASVIGIPQNIFRNTSIPVCILHFKKADSVLFIDASREFEKRSNSNVLRENDIEHITEVFLARKTANSYSCLSDKKDIENNDFNLNIPRYVDTYVPEELPDISTLINDYIKTEEEIRTQNKSFSVLLDQLVGTNEEAQEELKKFREGFRCTLR